MERCSSLPRALSGERKKAWHAEFTPQLPPQQLSSLEFLAGLAIWHFLPVPTARSGSGVKNIPRARSVPVPPPTAPWLCPRLTELLQ